MDDKRRDQILDLVKREFIGPDPIDWPGNKTQEGEEILISDPPRTRYIAGILFPQDVYEEDSSTLKEGEFNESLFGLDESPLEDRGEEVVSGVKDSLELAEELINRSNAYRQSAMSITAGLLENDTIRVEVSAGKYTTISIMDSRKNKMVSHYVRSSVFWNNDGQEISLPGVNDGIFSIEIPETNLRFDITYRYIKDRCNIYTFTLENTTVKSASFRDDDCYFQVEFKLSSTRGFCPLPDTQKINVKDEDYLSNQLLYRDVRNYAIGHGCAAAWDDNRDKVSWIKTSTLPTYEVKPIVPASINGVSLEMLNYGPDGDFDKSVLELYLLCSKYESWINEREEESFSLNREYAGKDFQKTASRHIENCRKCLRRMREGIELLKSDRNVRIAFQYMNLAMLMQQLHYNLPLQKWGVDKSENLFLTDPVTALPDPYDCSTWPGNPERYGKWRPFQLAFILMNLKAMRQKDCEDREIIDLIWFPTGGGKTEAYLGLSAYTIFIRRLMHSEDSGTAILMRYTLRLLTAQQYERASALICACEKIRQQHTDYFGRARISIGLWVGIDTTPNTMSKAVSEYNDLYSGKSDENPFVMLKCPWCGAQMGVIQKGEKLRETPGYYKKIGAHRKSRIIFKCYNSACAFSTEENPLPLHVIDEDIYESTPTLLLGTVDKFAMLPFRPEAQKIFGFYDGEKLTSPDLIIQDELHLISGPLGSMVGHYETLINELCKMNICDKEISPKIIASTATISRAKEQCHALYGCPKEKVFQFPPSGIKAEDSFFAHEDRNQNGRLYVGVYAAGSPSDDTTSIRLFSSLLYAAKEISVDSEKQRDPYWTNVGYFNSIRELGQARTWIKADIEQQLDVIYKRRHYDQIYEREEYRRRRRYIWRDEELTSRISGDKVTASLSDLNIAYTGRPPKELGSEEIPIDICLATNMISVGLDVPRLGLMTVAGQPKTTSEYIQATSRVGRNAADAPGLVFTVYRPGRPRDRSHYEHFKEYHSKLYCNVEPTSVTPFSAPVRDRALHAMMIGIMRLESGKQYNEGRPRVPDQVLLDHVEQVIRDRVSRVDPDEADDTMRQLEDILRTWRNWNPETWKAKRNKDHSFTDDIPLMYGAGEHPNANWEERGFETPTSMRSVDASCEAELLSNYRIPEE